MDYEILNITLKKGMPITGEKPVVLQPIVAEQFIFKGDEGNPFLAPRGVFIIKDQLLLQIQGKIGYLFGKPLTIWDLGCRRGHAEIRHPKSQIATGVRANG